MPKLTTCLLALCLAGACRAGETPLLAGLDEAGRVRRLPVGAAWTELRSDFFTPRTGWKDFQKFSNLPGLMGKTVGVQRVWKGVLQHAGDAGFEVTEKAWEEGGKLLLDFEATAKGDDDIEGLLLTLDVPTALFAGGRYLAGAQEGVRPQALSLRIHAGGKSCWRRTGVSIGRRSCSSSERRRMTPARTEPAWAARTAAFLPGGRDKDKGIAP